MTKNVLQFTVLFIVLILLQVVCNKIVLFGMATPIVFIYLILRLPINLHNNWTYTIAFAMGLIVDIFSNCPGMNALSCVVMAAIRRPVFNLYVAHEDDISPIPSLASLGVPGYFKYMATLVAAYCILLFSIQAFSLHNALLTLGRITTSTVLSVVLILAIDSLVSSDREKRL